MALVFLGGSFNPPHKGHLQVAEFARKATGARKVIFLVTPRNPFKNGKGLPSIEQRALELNKIAVKPWVSVSTLEKRFKLAESIKTVRLLKQLYPKEELYFAMGTDNIAHFHRWKCFMEILETVHVVFINRGGISLHQLIRKAKFPLCKVMIVYRQTISISSTQIRKEKDRFPKTINV